MGMEPGPRSKKEYVTPNAESRMWPPMGSPAEAPLGPPNKETRELMEAMQEVIDAQRGKVKLQILEEFLDGL